MIYETVRQTPVSIEIICHFLLNNIVHSYVATWPVLINKNKLGQAYGFSRLEKTKPEYERFFFRSYLLSCFLLTKLIVQSKWLHTMYFLTKQGQFPALRFFSLDNFNYAKQSSYLQINIWRKTCYTLVTIRYIENSKFKNTLNFFE